MATRAFDVNATRSVRRATIVYSSDDIRRNITLRLSDGLPCVLELGADIPITSGFTIPGGLSAFSIDGAQRHKFIVATSMPFLFYAKGAATDDGCPIEINNLEVIVKTGSTLATAFLIEQFGDNAPTDDRRPVMALKNLFIQAVDVGGITSVMEHSSFIDVIARFAVVDVDGVQCRNVTHFFGDTASINLYFGSFNNVTSTTTMSFGRGATGLSLASCSVSNLSGEIQISVGDISSASFVSCNVDSYTGNAGQNTLLRMQAFPRTVGPNEVDLDNITGGGGAPTNATYVTLSANATLTNERVLTAGAGVTIVDGGAGGPVTISASGSSPAIGGTITGGTAGSVLFVDPAATIAQDNANLFYDNANNRLGVGTNTPATNLHISGGDGLTVETVNAPWADVGSNVASSNYMKYRRPGTTAALGYIGGGAGGSISGGTADDLAIRSEASLYIATNGNVPQVIVDTGGKVGIGVFAPSELMTVNARLALAETTAPTATTGFGKIYVKASDGDPYYMDGAGVESPLLKGVGAGDSVVTDTVLTTGGERLLVSLSVGQYVVSAAFMLEVVGGSGANGFELLDSSGGGIALTGNLSLSTDGATGSMEAFVAPIGAPTWGQAGADQIVLLSGYIDVTTAGEFAVTLRKVGSPTSATLLAGSGIFVAPLSSSAAASPPTVALKTATITVPFGLQEQTATVVDASATVSSKVMVSWGNTASTDENQPSAENVTFSAVGDAGQVLITVSSNNGGNVGGTYKVLYILG